MTKHARSVVKFLDEKDQRLICAEALIERSTFVRYMSGQLVRPASAARIERAAETLGLADALRATRGA